MEKLLSGFRAVNIGYNLPAPLAASKITKLGAHVTKIEPPNGDPFQEFCEPWYTSLVEGQEITRLDLKTQQGREMLHTYLEKADLLITSSRPSSLSRLRLSPSQLEKLYPNLCTVSIVGHPFPDDELPGHDLTYQAQAGLVTPPAMPYTLLADILGSDFVVQAALGLLLKRSITGNSGSQAVSLAKSIEGLTEPLQYGVTTSRGLLGGANPFYNLYPTQEGWVAVAALEEKFMDNLSKEIGCSRQEIKDGILKNIFVTRTAADWEEWAKERDLPIAEVKVKYR